MNCNPKVNNKVSQQFRQTQEELFKAQAKNATLAQAQNTTLPEATLPWTWPPAWMQVEGENNEMQQEMARKQVLFCRFTPAPWTSALPILVGEGGEGGDGASSSQCQG